MEPVEINAGTCYLRGFRADELMDDRPALVEGFADAECRRWLPFIRVGSLVEAGEYVERRRAEWVEETRLSWVAAEPTTGRFLAEVLIKGLDLARGVGEVGYWAHPVARGRGVVTDAVGAVVRFGFGGLGLRELTCTVGVGNTASLRVAERVGFTSLREIDDTWVLVMRNPRVDPDVVRGETV
ncbi:GNAT family N-acetyltransferase [Actinokineospora bangkokensis]|uniref:GNAT family N-acetyltransferase n=1 Tax=Actinokineospora bangkokensis TaxID=1193682 RepID=A0A1Q9LEU5_9PSEU|nr:GNAT family N-acetyltransferase [Actinokineospora bangkokensis]OLR90489.1 GNAT family N-acetyltransferase [Actinokineospora bangkokensis]